MGNHVVLILVQQTDNPLKYFYRSSQVRESNPLIIIEGLVEKMGKKNMHRRVTTDFTSFESRPGNVIEPHTVVTLNVSSEIMISLYKGFFESFFFYHSLIW